MSKRNQTRAIEGATPAAMPGFIKPQLATLRSKAPKGPQWLHEIKYDGYRVQIHLNKGKKKVFTRNGLDWTKRVIAGALDLSGQAIIDGEVNDGPHLSGLERVVTRLIDTPTGGADRFPAQPMA
jgi:ATP-dependent DNA ligase